MLRVLLLLLVPGLMSGAQTQAGPWPRGEKNVFLSAHGNVEIPDNLLVLRQYATLYAEYGLTDTITLGVDYSGGELGTEKAILFVRIPVAHGDRPLKFSAELGIGLIDDQTALRPGVSVGRGVTLFKRNGWLTLDTRAIMPTGDGLSRIEADFTFGLSVSKRFKVILQLQGGMPRDGEDYLKFAPSVVYERKARNRRGKRKHRQIRQYYEFGVTTGLHNYDDYGVKFGIWREF